MSKATQTSKNLALTQKFLNYLISAKDLPNYLSYSNTYIIFSADDQELNKLNTKLLEDVLAEGKNVIKVEETGNKKSPWSFVQV